MIYVGIDPGKSGAIAIINDRKAEVHKFDSWSTHHAQLVAAIWETSGTDHLEDFPARDPGSLFCVIEKGQAMPGQGVSTMFSFGANCGGWDCLLKVLGIPHEYVRPNKWKARLGLSAKAKTKGPKGEPLDPDHKKKAKAQHKKAGKERSIKKACELFPQLAMEIGKDDNKAEALLLAEYGRRLRA